LKKGGAGGRTKEGKTAGGGGNACEDERAAIGRGSKVCGADAAAKETEEAEKWKTVKKMTENTATV